MEKKYLLNGLDCGHCAAKIEQKIQALPHVQGAQVDFMKHQLVVKADAANMSSIEMSCRKIVKQVEPDVVFETTEQPKEAVQQQESGFDRQDLVRIVLAAVGMLILTFLHLQAPADLAGYAIVYLVIGGDILLRAGKNILAGDLFDENFLMALATVGAMIIGEYPEAVAVMLFYQIGEFFQSYAVNRSRRSIKELLAIRPDYATIKVKDTFQQVSPETVAIGDTIYIRPGEKVPLDGVILEGNSFMDTSALTGEAVPRRVTSEDSVLSGFLNQEGLLKVQVTKDFENSTASRILELVENASSQKAPAEQFITKFARWYTPIVVCLALILAFLPPLVLQEAFTPWIYRALTFLVISCPCALVISVPLSFFGGIGGASKLGVLVKGSNYLEALAKVDTLVFDKTGTLTEGVFAVQKIAAQIPEQEFLRLLAAVESHSSHPIAKSILAAYGKPCTAAVSEIQELPGCGVVGKIDGRNVWAGNRKLLAARGVEVPQIQDVGTIVYLALDEVYAGYAVIADRLKETTAPTLKRLKKMGIRRTVMLTGDNRKTAEQVAQELGLAAVYTELLPEDKVAQLQEEMTPQTVTAFVGDGMNDAPVLTMADVGIAMGGLGSQAAIEAADVVIMDDDLAKIPVAIKLAQKTLRIVKQNIYFAIGIKGIVLLLGALGIANMYAAVFADVGVTVLAILNAIRCLKVNY